MTSHGDLSASAIRAIQALTHVAAERAGLLDRPTLVQYDLLLAEGGARLSVWAWTGGGGVEVGEGRRERPDVMISIALDEVQAILAGARDPLRLFVNGQISASGDLSLFMPIRLERGPALPRRSEEIAAGQARISEVDRRPGLSVEEFQERYVSRGTPVIVEGVITGWGLYAMEIGELRERLRGCQALARTGYRPELGAEGAQDDHEPKWSYSVVSIPDYLGSLERQGEAAECPLYLANSPLPDALRDLVEAPPLFPAHLYEPGTPQLWIGPAGAVTHLHRDNADNLLAQVRGSKRVLLASPDQREPLYTFSWARNRDGKGSEACLVNPERPDLERFPRFREAHLVETTLRAGDVLYIPEGWFHHVRSLTAGISVNYWTTISR